MLSRHTSDEIASWRKNSTGQNKIYRLFNIDTREDICYSMLLSDFLSNGNSAIQNFEGREKTFLENNRKMSDKEFEDLFMSQGTGIDKDKN